MEIPGMQSTLAPAQQGGLNQLIHSGSQPMQIPTKSRNSWNFVGQSLHHVFLFPHT